MAPIDPKVNLAWSETLTTVEREELHLVGEGLTNDEIATRLGISSSIATDEEQRHQRRIPASQECEIRTDRPHQAWRL